MKVTTTTTKGNVIIEEIKVGDIHFEYDLGTVCISKVVEKPILENGKWMWKSVNIKTGNIIEYMQNPEYPQYGLNLYNYQAYVNYTQV